VTMKPRREILRGFVSWRFCLLVVRSQAIPTAVNHTEGTEGTEELISDQSSVPSV